MFVSVCVCAISQGTIIAPPNPLDWQQNTYFIHFHNPNNCSVVGRSPDAEIEGHGLAWWTRNESKEKKGPSLIVFSGMQYATDHVTHLQQKSLGQHSRYSLLSIQLLSCSFCVCVHTYMWQAVNQYP